MKLQLKDGGAVDPDSGLSDSAHVLTVRDRGAMHVSASTLRPRQVSLALASRFLVETVLEGHRFQHTRNLWHYNLMLFVETSL